MSWLLFFLICAEMLHVKLKERLSGEVLLYQYSPNADGQYIQQVPMKRVNEIQAKLLNGLAALYTCLRGIGQLVQG